ncbi:MAG TPA: galactokinase [Opitutaceae bacterium]|nr:galactokinase [Opitutaceae bacterium]
MKKTLIAKFQAMYGRPPSVIARAPGRIEFIGNHTDYNGGTVLGVPIDRSVWVALAPAEDGSRRFATDFSPETVVVPATQLKKQSGAASWANYPLGVLAALPTFGLPAPGAFDYLALSDLPVGAGLSSSAAIELASALAFLALTGHTVARDILAKIGRHGENNFVGVPCGILDQGVSGFGEKDHLVFIDCRGPSFAPVPLPAGAHFWIFNTHTKHALVDGLYAARHRECMEAARSLGVACLADLTPAEFEKKNGVLAETPRRRARHVVEEIARVADCVAALLAKDLPAVGRLLTASHRSSQTLFENSTPELDFLVEALIAAPHVHGARLTGGGFGGAVMALTSGTFTAASAAKIAELYEQKFRAKPDALHCVTGNGAEVIR